MLARENKCVFRVGPWGWSGPPVPPPVNSEDNSTPANNEKLQCVNAFEYEKGKLV